MKRGLRIALITLGVVVVGGAVVAYRMYNKPHSNMAAAKADYSLTADVLFTAYDANEEGGNAEYLGKTIEVTGPVKEVTQAPDGTVKVILDAGSEMGFGVLCELDPFAKHPRTDFTAGETVTFKGICAGLNMDVQLSRCVEVKQ